MIDMLLFTKKSWLPIVGNMVNNDSNILLTSIKTEEKIYVIITIQYFLCEPRDFLPNSHVN